MAKQNDLVGQITESTSKLIFDTVKEGSHRTMISFIKGANNIFDEIDVNSTDFSSDNREKFRYIINEITIIEEEIIKPAIQLFSKKGRELFDSEKEEPKNAISATTQIVSYALQLGTSIQKLYNFIDTNTNDKRTQIQNEEKWKQSIRIVVAGQGATVSTTELTDENYQNILNNIFELRKTSRGLSVYINGNIEAIKALQQETKQKDIYEAIDQHYEHFKSFTEQNLFSFTLTKKKLNEIFSEIKLKGSKSSTSVWDWFKSAERKDGHGGYDLLVNNFGQFIQTLIDMHEHITETFEFIKYLNNTFSFHGQKTMNINYGHIAEAYEHHLEEHHGFNPGTYTISLAKKQLYPDEPESDDETQYYAWIRHLAEASGTWAGYLGPDTPFSQVKQIYREGGSLKYINRAYFIKARKDLATIIKIVTEILKDEELRKKGSDILNKMVQQKRESAKVDEKSIEHQAEVLAKQANKELFDRQ